MEKIFCIIVLFISVVFSGAAQTTKDKIQDGFKNGIFYLVVDNDPDNYSVMMFQSVDKEWSMEDGSACGAVFETIIMGDDYKRGEDWFKEKMKTEDGKNIMWETFHRKTGIVLGDDYTITEEGRARVSMTLME